MREETFWKLLTSVTAIFLVASIWGTLRYRWQPLVFENSDFEQGDLRNWEVEGQAFLDQPIQGDKPAARGRGSAAPAGRYWVGTFEAPDSEAGEASEVKGDRPAGRLISAPFIIKEPKMNFLLGAGNGGADTSVSLLVGESPVLVEVGRGKALDSEKMSRVVWDVSPWIGQEAQIIVTDMATGSWGHINVDDFRYGG